MLPCEMAIFRQGPLCRGRRGGMKNQYFRPMSLLYPRNDTIYAMLLEPQQELACGLSNGAVPTTLNDP